MRILSGRAARDGARTGRYALRSRTRRAEDTLSERFQPLIDAGRIVLAGPHPAIDSPEPGPAGMTGSLIVARFESLEDAENWANSDPYVEAGVYAAVSVKPFRKVLP